MQLWHLRVTLDRLDGVAALRVEHPLVVSCVDADTVIALASLEGRLSDSLGIWLHLNEGYSAQLAARDVATLSHLIDLTHVVITSDTAAEERAEVVRALLSEDVVDFTNAVANLRGAYNRPAPPRPLTVWSHDGGVLREGATRLHALDTVLHALGEMTLFA